MKNIIIFGAPGAGKGTQAELISKHYNLIHLSSGDLLRKEVASESNLGERIKTYQEKGELVPNDLITELIAKNVKENANTQGLIFDGYPRSVEQIYILNKILEDNNLKIDKVINLTINEKESLKRILLRKQISHRSDDNKKTIKNRLRVYRKTTAPVLDYYQQKGNLITINGEQSIKDVFKDIQKQL